MDVEANVIKRITDLDLGLEIEKIVNPETRTAARGIVENADGKIAIFYKSKMNEYKLPGGGIESGEDELEAFKREVLEETGCTLTDIVEIGTTFEEKSHTNFVQKSYVFKSKVLEDTKKLNVTEREKEEGAILIWLNPEEALVKMKESLSNLKESRFETNYSSLFIVKRDIAILEFFLSQK